MNQMEDTGPNFNLDRYLTAAKTCRNIVQQIASKVVAGMTEVDGQKLIKAEFQSCGINKFWHPSKFRIGADTTKNFRDTSDGQSTLAAGDLFFIDVGPIIDLHEADFGKTFICDVELQPNDLQLTKLVQDSIHVWKETAAQWKQNNLTGKALYKYADDCAASLGYRLNPFMGGHRLGDFPHALFHKGHLSAIDISPAENLWVLEIHLIKDQIHRGSFFEDILSR